MIANHKLIVSRKTKTLNIELQSPFFRSNKPEMHASFNQDKTLFPQPKEIDLHSPPSSLKTSLDSIHDQDKLSAFNKHHQQVAHGLNQHVNGQSFPES